MAMNSSDNGSSEPFKSFDDGSSSDPNAIRYEGDNYGKLYSSKKI
jgi:hypothetical protein